MSEFCLRLCQQTGQGVAQSTTLLQGVTEGGRSGRRSRSQRDRERVARHYCHSVTHSGHSVSPSVCGGPGHLVGDTLPFPPSIHCSLFQLTHKPWTPVLFVRMPRGFCHALFTTAIYHSHSCQSSHTGPSLRPWDVLFYIPAQSHPVPGSRTRSRNYSEQQRKNFDIRQEP